MSQPAADTTTPAPGGARIRAAGGFTLTSDTKYVGIKRAVGDPAGDSWEPCTLFNVADRSRVEKFPAFSADGTPIVNGPAILDTWGEGTYRITQYGADGTVVGGRPKTVRLEDPAFPRRPADAGAPPPVEAPPPPVAHAPAAPPGSRSLPPGVEHMTGRDLLLTLEWAEDRAASRHQRELETLRTRHQLDMADTLQRHQLMSQSQAEIFRQALSMRQAMAPSGDVSILAREVAAMREQLQAMDEEEDEPETPPAPPPNPITDTIQQLAPLIMGLAEHFKSNGAGVAMVDPAPRPAPAPYVAPAAPRPAPTPRPSPFGGGGKTYPRSVPNPAPPPVDEDGDEEDDEDDDEEGADG